MEVTDETIISILEHAPTDIRMIISPSKTLTFDSYTYTYNVHLLEFSYADGFILSIGRLNLSGKYVDTQFHEGYPTKPFEMSPPTMWTPQYLEFTVNMYGRDIRIPFYLSHRP